MNALLYFDGQLDTGLAMPIPSTFDPGDRMSATAMCAVMDRLLQLEVNSRQGQC